MAMKHVDTDALRYIWTKIKSYFVAKEPGKGLSSNDYTAEDKAKLTGLSNYSLPAATADALGGVKVGEGLRVDPDGTLSTEPGEASSVDWANVDGKPEAYPPEAHEHNWSDISDPPKIPADTADLTNGAGYQTAADVKAAIAREGLLTRKKVDSLPSAEEADAHTIYMVPIPDADGQNRFTEWMVMDGAWEMTGDSTVDLTGYLREEDLVPITNEEIDEIMQ